MDKKFTIGLIYLVDQNWIGGTYYIENIILALKELPLAQQPHLVIYCYTKGEFEKLKSKTEYEFLTPCYVIYSNFFAKGINWLSILFLKRHLLLPPLKRDVDILYLTIDQEIFRGFKKKVYWIPDFQELHFPSFFREEERIFRKKAHKKIIEENCAIILSSKCALSDFVANYTTAKNPVYVIPFTVTIPGLEGINLNDLKKKYRIDGEYFISSNQFWAHKNHIVVIKAIHELKKRNIRTTVLFTGKPFDNRSPDYFENLVKYVSENELEEEIKFLGFIDRKDQLMLMKNSKAIIQPSLFEGWSTVVEDAKALKKLILVSDIPVHREQLGSDFKYFFKPEDSKALAFMMEGVSGKDYDFQQDYKLDVLNFSNNFLNTMINISKS